MTVTSFTNPNKHYETTLEHCTCPDYQYRQSKIGGHCKHQQAIIIRLANRDTIFGLLKMKFDCRSQHVIEAKRAAYFYYEMALSA